MPEGGAGHSIKLRRAGRAAIPRELAGRPVEIWFQDEARVGQQGTLTGIWAKRGTRPRIKRDRRFTRFTWAYLFGAICPARGTGAALVMPTVSIAAMNQHLVEISHCVSVSAIALLILDSAGWHGSPRLVVPHRAAATSTLRAGAELDREPLGVSAQQLAQPLRLGHL